MATDDRTTEISNGRHHRHQRPGRRPCGTARPARAGMAVFNVAPDPASLSPWIGFAVLLAYAAMTLLVGGLLLARRDD